MKFTFSILLLVFLNTFSFATETKIIVRAKAKDAKFIGSSLGGAYVIIKNKMTDEILAKGKTEGSTGNTDLIMKSPKERGVSISDENTAKFMASIDIDEPIFISIEVYSPINNKQARVNASTELWLIPGKHILGDGIIIEIPGFIIDILEPRTHHYISLATVQDKPFKLKANVVMMCGCTINKNGIWDSEKIEVKAIVKLNDKLLKEIPLNFVSTNLFEGDLIIEKEGQYEVIIYAYDKNSGNTGVDKVNYVIYK
ncbi:MAG: hypothetical protein ACI8YQ_001562 [Polaribacter sp.]|jgi:hypothetical protein